MGGDDLQRAREQWNHRGSSRPEWAIEPGPGQESVWDYPRPPALSPDTRRVEVRDGDSVIADTTGSFRVLETASPPTFYLPPDDIDESLLVAAAGSSVCEWKGEARYLALASRPDTPIGWYYPRPRARFERIRHHVAFYPGRIDCIVDGEHVQPQPGRFYGGWITKDIVGPFKGEPGSSGW